MNRVKAGRLLGALAALSGLASIGLIGQRLVTARSRGAGSSVYSADDERAAIVDATGGIVAAHGVTLEFPPGAVRTEAAVSIHPVDAPRPRGAMGTAFEVECPIRHFAAPVGLLLPAEQSVVDAGTDLGRLQVAYLQGGVWHVIGGQPEPGGVRAMLTHLTTVSLFLDPEGPEFVDELRPSTPRDYLEKYRPVLRGAREDSVPVSLDDLLEHAALIDRGVSVEHPSLAELRRADDPNAYLDIDDDYRPNDRAVVYGRALLLGDQMFLQYYLLFSHSALPAGPDGAMSSDWHEGDVEMMQIGLRRTAIGWEPAWIDLSEHYVGSSLDWPSSQSGEVAGRPMVVIAAGSHALYFDVGHWRSYFDWLPKALQDYVDSRPSVDVAPADAREIDYQLVVPPHDAAVFTWRGRLGRPGRLPEVFGSSGPRLPAQRASFLGTVRMWVDPEQFHIRVRERIGSSGGTRIEEDEGRLCERENGRNWGGGPSTWLPTSEQLHRALSLAAPAFESYFDPRPRSGALVETGEACARRLHSNTIRFAVAGGSPLGWPVQVWTFGWRSRRWIVVSYVSGADDQHEMFELVGDELVSYCARWAPWSEPLCDPHAADLPPECANLSSDWAAFPEGARRLFCGWNDADEGPPPTWLDTFDRWTEESWSLRRWCFNGDRGPFQATVRDGGLLLAADDFCWKQAMSQREIPVGWVVKIFITPGLQSRGVNGDFAIVALADAWLYYGRGTESGLRFEDGNVVAYSSRGVATTVTQFTAGQTLLVELRYLDAGRMEVRLKDRRVTLPAVAHAHLAIASANSVDGISIEEVRLERRTDVP